MKTFALLSLALLSFTTPTWAGSQEDRQVDQATTILQRFKTMPEHEIPQHVLREAKGLAILTVTKGGFIWSGKIGQGVVVARNRNGWSGPAFIRTGGVGFGAQIGANVTEFVLVLNTPEAVQAFAREANVRLGGELSVAAGPVGRSAEAGITPSAAVYAYSRSQGLFAGVSLEGSVIGANTKANRRYYGRPVSPSDILAGRTNRPLSAMRLARQL
jgi:lipid-binding SYLF domain-containing protein